MKLPRVYPILDTDSLERVKIPMFRAAAAMLEAGAEILQFRHKGFWSRAVFEDAQHVARLCREAGANFVVDDRADMALLLRAGLHLGQEDLPPRDARRLMGPDPLIGYSTHNREQLSAGKEEPVDYLGFGPVFATSSKRNPGPVTALDQLRQLRPLVDRPLVAIGGITRENASLVFEAGADAVAVIADLVPEDCSETSLKRRMEEWQQLART